MTRAEHLLFDAVEESNISALFLTYLLEILCTKNSKNAPKGSSPPHPSNATNPPKSNQPSNEPKNEPTNIAQTKAKVAFGYVIFFMKGFNEKGDFLSRRKYPPVIVVKNCGNARQGLRDQAKPNPGSRAAVSTWTVTSESDKRIVTYLAYDFIFV